MALFAIPVKCCRPTALKFTIDLALLFHLCWLREGKGKMLCRNGEVKYLAI